jgi:GDP-D-mannose 3',5'-epimerase
MRAVVTGGCGFVGTHLVKYLKDVGWHVTAIDIKQPEFGKSEADEVILHDLRYPAFDLFKNADDVYHLAADMGGIGYIETHKANIVWNNTMMNALVLKACQELEIRRFFFSSSACIYPTNLQQHNAPFLKEEQAYPAFAEDGYGWEKLMMERNCKHFADDYGMDIKVARFHNIYGELGTYDGGREKSPAALCRKVAQATDSIEIWGTGHQTRSYCHVEDCVEGIYRLMNSNHHEPINLGTDRLVSINELADIIIKISGKKLTKTYDITKPKGVHGRNADISKAREILGWEPQIRLEDGLERTYRWICAQIYQS